MEVSALSSLNGLTKWERVVFLHKSTACAIVSPKGSSLTFYNNKKSLASRLCSPRLAANREVASLLLLSLLNAIIFDHSLFKDLRRVISIVYLSYLRHPRGVI